MKIEEGKRYHTQSGKGGGIARRRDGDDGRVYFLVGASHYTQTGRYSYRGRWPRTLGDERDGLGGMDLVGACDEQASPVRTVTRKEIVPGVYGRVNVFGAHSNGLAVGVRLTVEERSGNIADMRPDELRAAAATLIEIADALTASTEGAANA